MCSDCCPDHPQLLQERQIRKLSPELVGRVFLPDPTWFPYYHTPPHPSWACSLAVCKHSQEQASSLKPAEESHHAPLHLEASSRNPARWLLSFPKASCLRLDGFFQELTNEDSTSAWSLF